MRRLERLDHAGGDTTAVGQVEPTSVTTAVVAEFRLTQGTRLRVTLKATETRTYPV